MIWVRVLAEPEFCAFCWCEAGCFGVADGHPMGTTPLCASCVTGWLQTFRDLHQLPIAV